MFNSSFSHNVLSFYSSKKNFFLLLHCLSNLMSRIYFADIQIITSILTPLYIGMLSQRFPSYISFHVSLLHFSTKFDSYHSNYCIRNFSPVQYVSCFHLDFQIHYTFSCFPEAGYNSLMLILVTSISVIPSFRFTSLLYLST